jgi:DUF4097 and DUF4098 domain-containing protein YvlB
MEPFDQDEASASSAAEQPYAPRSIVRLGRVTGDLHVRTWEGESTTTPHVRLIGDETRLDIAPSGNTTAVPDGDLTLLVAGSLDLSIQGVMGDLVVNQLVGALDIDQVQGDATLDAITGAVMLRTVQGDTTAVHLGDDLTLVNVQGDAAIDDVRGTVRLDTVSGDVTVRHVAAVDIASCKGDLRAQDLTSLTVRHAVQGDATVAHVQSCVLHRVDGDLTALDISELLQAPDVQGDVRLRDIQGQVRLAAVQGDLAAQDVLGGILAEAQGDAYLETRLVAGMTYQVTANEIVLRARSPISAQFVAQSEGEIVTHLPLTVERHRQALAGVIGQGEATVTLTSTGGDIVVDAAGAESGDESFARHQHGKHGFRVHVKTGPGGPHINVEGIPGVPDIDIDQATFGWPFRGGFSMSTNADPNAPRDYSEMESRLQDLGERTGRAARKAAEKVRDYADRMASRARETDWEAVSHDVRTVIERTVGELESTFREIASEFEKSGSTSGTDTPKAAGPTAQRVTIERDPVDSTATPVSTTTARSSATTDSAARRRAILEQVKSGELTLEEAEAKLQDL